MGSMFVNRERSTEKLGSVLADSARKLGGMSVIGLLDK